MCLYPIPRRNVNKGQAHVGLNFMKDCENEFMYVPCGRCSECVAAKQSDFVQRVMSEARYNHLFFATLTYDNAHLPRLTVEVPAFRFDSSRHSNSSLEPSLFDQNATQFDSSQHHNPALSSSVLPEADSNDSEFDSSDNFVPFDITDFEAGSLETDLDDYVPDESGTLSGEDVSDPEIEYKPIEFTYADIHHIQLMMKNIRDNNPLDGRCIRYACVSELGKMNGRPHFHVLFFVEKRPGDFNSLGQVDPFVMHGIEQKLYKAVFKYWSINVGTRKYPVYEPLFTYKRKWSYNRIYTNFDLHWVDPSKTPATGVSNVAFYVSKYMMKGSDRDVRRQRFLKLNLAEEDYASVWRVIKCRMTCSKGLGLDARCEVVESSEPGERLPLVEYCKLVDSYIDNCDDLPDIEEIRKLSLAPPRVRRRRILVPNFELVQKLREDLSRDIGQAPGPIFISSDGTHRPLSHYYQRFGYLFTTTDAINIWMNWNSANDIPSYDKSPEEKEKLQFLHSKRLKQIDAHSSFDNLSTVDMPADVVQYIY